MLTPGKSAARRAALAAGAARDAGDRARDDRRRAAVLAELLEGARLAAYASFGTEPATPPCSPPTPCCRCCGRTATSTGRGTAAAPRSGSTRWRAATWSWSRRWRSTARGVRLGRGGGSYDRALRRARGLVVALLHEGELVDALPAEPHDVPVHAVALPAGSCCCARLAVPPDPWDHPPMTTNAFEDVLDANARYAAKYQDEGKPGRAARGLAVVTCMDSRIEPLQMLGLERGDAKILRNAGARVTDDVLRTLVLAVALLGVGGCWSCRTPTAGW